MTLTDASVPALARHVRLRFDAARNCHVLLAPERVIMPDAIAVAILECCDGAATIGAIADALATRYAAPRDAVLTDCLDMLNDLAGKGMVTA
ncbi:pyrroloquinoline quinone biosynthesis peptide chaperone PqqD [Acidiphilium sp. AL]|uniref:Pyrroloquinoline quinone biosynthesis peptide chaperone PqqD n=1 Tax=Acidiphilium iwatense TaxID=768198 RepID=A0ABS9E1C4_9PROT|nr:MULTISPECIES: pyrroloquinoline quinone biosynthesis peptide chaperone PqqD [Acidiphilium]MCF3948814.1 pyrroloquinoline quinone biosynthesis peptide chaperone PqqD [Acidiphilium iwatense]MCU4161788.1 pyrroloquinoline quinone biosynthesis peptide chaperone PqqD [Acidiphilium sp. AL]